ncbi:TolB family protein [Microlunatus antarcticus]|uniref:Tol biopolymer transport system component n=1 Tax=Microlunatus antarcticus TaxID=53388 RepID=A0A7W5P7U3_9ACTN|nr:biopolymer transporter Tol [Microlunatus antarcticus]MBB3327878.1 Tol biopolymer transport system component [Microlunatus antarcticus]
MAPRVLAAGQRSQVWLGGPGLETPELVLETADLLLEAPNWTRDGRLVLNGDGVLWTLDPADPSSGLRRIDLPDLPEVNNDHVLDPDGEHVYASAMDRHVYRGSLSGGPVERVTRDDGAWHFLHGVSPDGTRLAYVELRDLEHPVGRLVVLDRAGTTAHLETGPGHLDGPEWSPDGAWIYVNTEGFTSAPGHAQLARLPAGGGTVERLVTSGTVDWFPHLSPDSAYGTYIAFPAGTLGHPADLDVEVRVVSTQDWSSPLQRYPVRGGQGTINVNSWSPDSTRFAFVAYPDGR